MLSTTSTTRGADLVAAAPDTQARGRIAAIDFTKGALVVFMVVYHTLNYSAWRALPGQFMAFLPPSFILITGFLLTNVYTAKYQAGSWPLYQRLLLRGLKLVLIFTALNVAGNALFAQNYNGQKLGLADFFRQWQSVFAFGSARKSAFEILLPIGYLLLAAPVLLRACFVNVYLLPVLAAVLFVACVWMEQVGFEWRIAKMLTVGVVGMAAGQVPVTKWEAVARQWPYVIAAYLIHWIGRLLLGQMYVVQVCAACASVLLIYAMAIRLDGKARLVEEINRLGRYSLVAYIAQIVILQVLYRVPWYDRAWPLDVVCLGGGTLIITWGTIYLIEALRLRSSQLDGIYRATFG